MVREEGELRGIGPAVRVTRAEADGPEDAREERDVVIVERGAREVAALQQAGGQVETQDVGLAFLDRARLILQRLPDAAVAVDGRS